MKKIPNELSKFMYQLSNGNKDYRTDFLFNQFELYDENTPVVKLGHTIKKHHVTLNPKLSNGDQSELIGRGCDIVNALCYGFRTDKDIAHYLSISKRTVDRLFNKSNNGKPYFKHVLRLVNVKDNVFHHYHYDKNKGHYQLKTNNVFGRWRAKRVVDNVTFTHFDWIIHSPVIKHIKKKYRFSTPLQLVHQTFKQEQQLQKFKLKHYMFIKFATKYNNDTFGQLINVNNLYSSHITNVELYFHNLTDFPVLSRSLLWRASKDFGYIIKKQYSDSTTKLDEAMRYTITDAFMYVYLFHKLSKKYKNYRRVYHPDKYYLMTKAKWNILRLVEYRHFI